MIPYATSEELGRIIRDERKRKGYTQTKLAHYSGVGINFISNLENGKESSELGKTLRVIQTLGMDAFIQVRGER